MYMAPSWSWASIKTPIKDKVPSTAAQHKGDTFKGDPPFEIAEAPMAAELIDCSVKISGKDPYGQITHATITLRGFWLQFSNWKAKSPIHVANSWEPLSLLPWKELWSMTSNFDELDTDDGGSLEKNKLFTPNAIILSTSITSCVHL